MAIPNLSQRIAQSIGVRAYALNLSTLAPQQIAYNGKFTFIALRGGYPPPAGWCHLLLLRGASRWLAVITQPADCGFSIVNTIEHIASFLLYFFNIPLLLDTSMAQDEDEDEENKWQHLALTPQNTTFVQYLPAGCFGKESLHRRHEYSVMRFSWQERQFEGWRYFQAGKPLDAQWDMAMWKDATREGIEDLIQNL